MGDGQTGPTGRSVARSVEEEIRSVNGPAVTRQLDTGGRSVRERKMMLVCVTTFLVSKTKFVFEKRSTVNKNSSIKVSSKKVQILRPSGWWLV